MKTIKILIENELISIRYSDEDFVRIYNTDRAVAAYNGVMDAMENGYTLRSTSAYKELLALVQKMI